MRIPRTLLNPKSMRALRPSIFVVTLLMVSALPGGAATLVSQTVWGTPDFERTDGVATGPDGSVYLTGFHADPLTSSTEFLVKFAPDGTVAWQQNWDGPFQLDDLRDVAVSSDGSSVYVAGTSVSSAIAPNDAVLLKFNASNGALEWDRSWGGNAAAEGVEVAADGSVYVAGVTQQGFSSQISVTRFSPDGAVLWHKRWDKSDPEGRGASYSQDVAVDAVGNVYVAGATQRADEPIGFLSDVVLLKIDPAGDLVWQRTVTAGASVDARGGVAVAPDGSVYVAGARTDERTFDLNALVLKFAPDGSLLWNRNWGGRSGDDAHGIVVVANGAVIVAGNTNSFGSGSDDAYVLSLEPAGKAMDAVTWGGPMSDHADAIAQGAAGVLVIGATAEEPPYSFSRAPTHTAKDKAILRTPNHPLVSVDSGVMPTGGTVAPISGTAADDPGFDAAVVIIAP